MQSVLMGWGLKLVQNLAHPAQSLVPRVDVGMTVIRSTGRPGGPASLLSGFWFSQNLCEGDFPLIS